MPSETALLAFCRLEADHLRRVNGCAVEAIDGLLADHPGEPTILVSANRLWQLRQMLAMPMSSETAG